MTIAQYSSEYIEFIKHTLINQCVIEFKREVFEKQPQDYKDVLVSSIQDITIWNTVFKKLEPIFNFYTDLEYNYISDNHKIYIFQQQTFQEYIDNLINLKTVGPVDYQTFIKNMQNTDFHNKMTIKYRIDMHKNTLKNHLIFIVELYIMETFGHKNYYINEYDEFVPTIINAVPYFEYLSEKGWTTQDIENNSLYEHSSNIGERRELKALKQIQQTMFV